MRTKTRYKRQMSLDDLVTATARWNELPNQTRNEVLELLMEMLREHVASSKKGGGDER